MDSTETPDRNELALMRTQLSNKRTLLTYLRMAMGLTATGIGLIHFLSERWLMSGIGVVCLIGAAIVIWIGTTEYSAVRQNLRKFDPGL